MADRNINDFGTVTDITAGQHVLMIGTDLLGKKIEQTDFMGLFLGKESAMTQGSVIFIGATGKAVQDNTNLIWDNAANLLTVSAITLLGNTAKIFADGDYTVGIRDGAFTSYLSIHTNYNAVNYSRLTISGDGVIQTEKGGTGTIFSLDMGTTGSTHISFFTNNQARWKIEATGHLTAGTDNSLDIGASGATRPRNLFMGGYIQLGNAAVAATPTPTHTITIRDSTGTVYRVPCVV